MGDVKAELLALLAERERRIKSRLLDTLYPEKGPYRRELYPKHMEFFAAGRAYFERCMMAANRVGKSFGAGGYEVTLHLTGLYPVWWEGRRFNHPVQAWAAGTTSKTTRDTIQRILLGDSHNPGTGLIPGDLIVNKTIKPGISDGIEDIYVKHVSGGISHIGLKSYEQGPESFMGTARHIIWMDEEPPLDVYSEAQTRTMIVEGASASEKTTGIILSTFTPLNGLSDVVLSFMPDGQIPTPGKSKKFVIQVTWDEVPHLTKEMKETLWEGLPPHERNARSKGTPQLGSGKIYHVEEEDILIEPFAIPKYWPRWYAMDIGFTTPTAVVWMAIDRETDCIYIYREYYQREQLPYAHAHAIKVTDPWMPGIIDPASRIGGQRDGTNILHDYAELGLILYPADNAIEAGIFKVHERLQTGRLRVFTVCKNWFSEYRTYRRDKHGKVAAKQADHLMDATRYGVMSGPDIAMTEPKGEDDEMEYREYRTGLSRVCGY